MRQVDRERERRRSPRGTSGTRSTSAGAAFLRNSPRRHVQRGKSAAGQLGDREGEQTSYRHRRGSRARKERSRVARCGRHSESQTRLDVPAMASKLLSQPELVTVLAAVLSAPPVGAAEAPLSRLSPIDGTEF